MFRNPEFRGNNENKERSGIVRYIDNNENIESTILFGCFDIKHNKERSGIVRYKYNNEKPNIIEKKERSGIVRYKLKNENEEVKNNDENEEEKDNKKDSIGKNNEVYEKINIISLKDLDISIYYKLLYQIYSNWYSTTYKGKNKETGKLVMITKIPKLSIEKDLINFFNKLNKLQSVNHIITIYDQNEYFYVVEDYLLANLSDSIKASIEKEIKLFHIQKIILKLKEIFEELNNNKIICGGFELEKIGFSSFFDDWNLKISPTMFLNSLYLFDKEKINDSLNEIPILTSPELFNRDNTLDKSDIWSLGVLIYYLTFNEYPFKGKFDFDNFQKRFTTNLKTLQDKELADLLSKTLKVNINERITFNDFFNHSFLTNNYEDVKSIKKLEEKLKRKEKEIEELKRNYMILIGKKK